MKVSRANVVARNQKRLKSLTCEQCGDEFSAKRGGNGIRFGRWCPKCQKIKNTKSSRRTRKLKAIKRRKEGVCTLCGETAAEGKAKCQKHLDQYNEYAKQAYRRKIEKDSQDSLLKYPLGTFIFIPTTRQEKKSEATNAQPGSEEKILTLQERVSKGLPLFHPEDRTNKMPQFNFEAWVADDHPEPTVSSMATKERDCDFYADELNTKHPVH